MILYYADNGGTILACLAERDPETEESLRATTPRLKFIIVDQMPPMDGSVVVRHGQVEAR